MPRESGVVGCQKGKVRGVGGSPWEVGERGWEVGRLAGEGWKVGDRREG